MNSDTADAVGEPEWQEVEMVEHAIDGSPEMEKGISKSEPIFTLFTLFSPCRICSLLTLNDEIDERKGRALFTFTVVINESFKGRTGFKIHQ